ncbi:DUF2145 domain-containing protein [Caballeronia insecticola]|uniref:Outer membrane protein n=1 Tax=Caballeronia insecticola TaxID=758793 RepID=R4X2Z1_9BURK|nr:DUF2145 domain-containing protein [Caballeronia insecticola]BAN27011.1 putative uncharacterized protein [Caballeronia insecticola]
MSRLSKVGARRALCAAIACGALFGLMPASASAGQACTEVPLTPDTITQAMAAAQRVTAELERRQIDVAVLGRMGQDLSAYGLRYSHVGFVYREKPGAPWRIAHLLNECGTAKSDLWYQGVGNFFLDDMYRFDALLLIPPKPVAEILRARLMQGPELRTVFDSHYSMVAYPFSTRYQNSNTWVLETLASVEAKDAKIGDREQAQAWLKMAGYQPSEMQLGPFKRLGGRMFKANIAFDDHPNELRFSDRIRTVTVDSVQRFLLARQEGWEVTELTAP